MNGARALSTWRRRRQHIGAWLLLACATTGAVAAVPSFQDVRNGHRPSDTAVLDQDGAIIHRLRTDATVRRGQWISLTEVSPALRTALVLSEDQRFFEHSGVDWRAVSAAAWGNLWNSRTRGASTITMQLAGLLDDGLRRGTQGRSVPQKVEQALSAQRLERGWRKDQILEAYLNLVPWRGELVGIDALSRGLFGKAPHGLDARESAVAAALVRAPNAAAQRVAQRACAVLRAMAPDDVLAACAGLELFTSAVLQRRNFPASEGLAPHFARQLARTPGPDTVHTTLRAPLQRVAVASLQRHLRELQGRHVEDGAIVVLDNATGAVLAWVGSSGALSTAAEVDGVTALRQPGSTLKPFLYAQAIAERRLTAASLLEDAPTQIPTAGGLYLPRNYDHRFRGWVSARMALAASLNVPAVRTLVMVSPDAFHRQLVAVGLPLRETGDYFGYSLALGSAEVSLLDLTNAYRTLANGGRHGPVSWTAKPVPAPAGNRREPSAAGKPPMSAPMRADSLGTREALDPRAAYIVADILADPLARASTFGTDSVLATRFWSAVKTGTSKDMRDNWALGFSQAYTVGVWVGNASGAPMHDVSGTSGAAPIWADLMRFLHRDRPSQAPRAPPGVERLPVRFADAHDRPVEAARAEWFLAGTGQTRFALQSRAASGMSAAARITSPADGSVIALDPDIPPAHQRLPLRAQGDSVHWVLDGKPLARGASAAWLPWPGRHVLRITDAQGVVQDEVRIEVRGAAIRRTP